MNHLLYGLPPPGLDVRLSLDLDTQRAADRLLGEYKGAAVLLNAENGEILSAASHPTYDANQLDAEWEGLIQDPDSPLLNRATQGAYLTGSSLAPALATILSGGNPPGDPAAELLPSPLQMALAAAALTNGGLQPAPQIVLALETPAAGWLPLSAASQEGWLPEVAGLPVQVLSAQEAAAAIQDLAVADASGESGTIWENVSCTGNLDDLPGENQEACWLVQNPNFFGVIEDLYPILEKVHENGSLMTVGFSEALAYGILNPPRAMGADIVAGEGQSLGIPLSFGGPYLGIFTTKNQFVRTMPGRLVGETVDLEGRRGFVLTLATREQHIRREKATSNICTNEGLCALMATIYLSCLGKEGLRELAMMNLSKTEYARKAISQVRGCKVAFPSPTFNEFVLEIEKDPGKVLGEMRKEKIIGGLPLARFYPELNRHLLITVTEINTKEEIDRLANTLEKALKHL